MSKGKKPICDTQITNGIFSIFYYCPMCNRIVGIYDEESGMDFQDKFCRECGQKIDWSEENGN